MFGAVMLDGWPVVKTHPCPESGPRGTRTHAGKYYNDVNPVCYRITCSHEPEHPYEWKWKPGNPCPGNVDYGSQCLTIARY